MGDPGLPDNWGANTKCPRCGFPRHDSGTVECACPALDETAAEEIAKLQGEAAKLREHANKLMGESDWAAAANALEVAASIEEETVGLARERAA